MSQQERDAVISVARSWIGTPYHHMGQVKGAGVDCLTLLACVYAEAGLIEMPQIAYYPQEWHIHRSEELYLGGLETYCAEVDQPLPADIALFKFGRCFSHGSIVIDWPSIIHAYNGERVGQADVMQQQHLRFIGEMVAGAGRARPVKFFRLKRWMA